MLMALLVPAAAIADSKDTGVFLSLGAGYELFDTTYGSNPYSQFRLEACYGFDSLPAALCAGAQHMSSYRDGKPFNDRRDKAVLDGPFAELKIRIF
jgi:hypothetical protein